MNFWKKLLLIFILFTLLFLNLNFKKRLKKIKEYKIIVAYFNGNPDEVSEDWSFFIMDIEEAFKDTKNFHLIELFKEDSTTILIEEENKKSLEIDVKNFVKEESGYIFIQNNKESHWENYSPSFIVIENALKYFNK